MWGRNFESGGHLSIIDSETQTYTIYFSLHLLFGETSVIVHCFVGNDQANDRFCKYIRL